MNSLVVKNELQLRQWASIVQECQSSGMKKNDWLRLKGITKDRYYYWRRKFMDQSLKAVSASFVEIPRPAQESETTEGTPSCRFAASFTIGTTRLNIHDSASEPHLGKTASGLENSRLPDAYATKVL